MSYYKRPLRPPSLEMRRGNADFREFWMSRYIFNGDCTAACAGWVIKAHKETVTWDAYMARKTYRIELKIDFNDDSRHAALLEVAKQYCRDLLASAMLLQDGRKPQAILMTDDNFVGVEEINIMEQSDNIHIPDTTT